LIIGINNYPFSPEYQSLRGALADAQAVDNYLRASYGVNAKVLYDGQATRKNIIDSIQALASGNFKKGDPIVIFFAGHGARAHCPQGWVPSTDGFIEGIVPYDFGKEGTTFIPDRTLAAILNELARNAVDPDSRADPNIVRQPCTPFFPY
jgi:hypothetical protein